MTEQDFEIDCGEKANNFVFNRIETTMNNRQDLLGLFQSSLFKESDANSEDCISNRTNSEKNGDNFSWDCIKLYTWGIWNSSMVGTPYYTVQLKGKSEVKWLTQEDQNMFNPIKIKTSICC